MTAISDFNRIEDCDKIDAKCVNGEVKAFLNEEAPTKLDVQSSWGDSEVDLTPAVKAGETLTTLYLSPATTPNCLVYEPERGDNVCIHGDNLSRIVSMKYLKDVAQPSSPTTGDVYMLGSDSLFRPFALQSFVDATNASLASLQGRLTAVETSISGLATRMAAAETNISALQTAVSNLQTAVAALQTTVAAHGTRLDAIEALLTKPTGAPNGASIVWGTVNLYSDHSAAINGSGAVTSLDKTHGLYSHNLNTTAQGDEILG